MDDAVLLDMGQKAILMLLKVSSPILLTALAVGLLVSLVQAITQLQEQTLSFIPKIMSVLLVLLALWSFIGNNFNSLFQEVIRHIGSIGQ